MSLIKIDQNKVIAKQVEEAKANRAAAFQQESDPLYFKAQRGEATLEEWQDKVDEIRNRYPYPDED